jgi:hypothetical protein
MAKRLEFVVEIDQPEGATVADVHAYIEQAVIAWSGSLRPPGEDDPGDPCWGIGSTAIVKPRARILSE